MATQVASLFAKLELDDASFVGGMQRANQGLGNLAGGLQSAGQRMQRMGTQMTLLTAPFAAGLFSAARASMNFDEAMTNAGAILGQTREEMSGLRQDILDIGGASRAGPQAAAEAFYTIVSGVQDATTHMDILQNAIALAEAGNAELTTTTDGLVAVMNAYQFAAEDAQFVSDTFTRTVQMGVGTMDQFVAAMGPAASLSDTLGIGFDELAGATAYLTTQGTSASQSVTQLTGIMSAFLKPNEAMIDALQAMGVESGEAAIQQFGLHGAVEMLSEVLGGSTSEMAKAMGAQEALRGAVALLGDGYSTFSESFQEDMAGVTEATRELQNESDPAGWDLLRSSLEKLNIVIGDNLAPILSDLVDQMGPVVEEVIGWIQENPELTKQILLITLGLIALGPVVGIVGTAFSLAGGLVGGFTGAIAFLLSPIGLAIAGGVALGAAIYYILDALGVNWDSVLGTVVAAFEAAFGAIGDTIKEVQGFLDTLAAWFEENDLKLLTGVLGFEEQRAADVRQTGQWAGPIGGMLIEGVTGLLGFAGGGDFMGDQPFIVGEQGPEMIFPGGMSGTVVPNHALGGMNIESVVIHANSYAEGQQAARGFNDEMVALRRFNG